MSGDESQRDPIPGLPAHLPAGEALLWQGSPDWRVLLKRPFHVWAVGGYFVALMVLQLAIDLSNGVPVSDNLRPILLTGFLGLLAMAILAFLAWATARVTIYSITSERVMLRIGIALSITLNLPFRRIVAADLRLGERGTGDIPLKLESSGAVGYLTLWPHVRPWRFRDPEPMLRAIPEAGEVAECLASAVARHAEARRLDGTDNGESKGHVADTTAADLHPVAAFAGNGGGS